MNLKKIIRNIITFFLTIASLPLFAQDKKIEMADVMRSNGKIYVVVAVIVAIFVGILIYLIILDRKTSKLEKAIKQLEK